MSLTPNRIEVGNRTMSVQPLFTEARIKARVAELAAEISQAHGSQENLVILVVLHGALLFAADLVRGLTMPTEIETVRLRSYHGTESTGAVELVGALPSLQGKHVLVVEDIVDTGKSISFLKERLATAGLRSLKVATLLDKPDAHGPETAPDYTGFSIGRNFVIGYGLDLDGRYRNLPYVAELVAL
jgi:hypoxanthine phosphoribosyltransferase